MKSIMDLLQVHASNKPSNQAFTYLVDGENQEMTLTFHSLYQNARSVANYLQNSTGRSDRVLLVFPPGLEFIIAFFGCLLAGRTAVPILPPRKNRSTNRITQIAQDTEAKIGLVTKDINDRMKPILPISNGLDHVKWVAQDEMLEDFSADASEVDVKPDDLAFIQFTSGSIGSPKGVMVSHRSLLQNSQIICRNWNLTPQTVGVGWLPVYHDMGLVGNLFQSLFLGIPYIFLAPMAFLQRPIRWLKAISKYKGTTSGGPNFSYDLCVQKIREEDLGGLDLSSWEIAYNGAEPVRIKSLNRFFEKFSRCGFRKEAFFPCYGLAEATLMVSSKLAGEQIEKCDISYNALKNNLVEMSPTSHSQNSVSLMSCGKSGPNTQIVIVNPDNQKRCSPNEVGEIWVASTSIASGYWKNPQETKTVFKAFISNTEEGPFLRTGDLGFLKNGELYITGRLKDLIIIRGYNYYPQDIEMAISSSHSSLIPGMGAAFSIDSQGQEVLVITQELRRKSIFKKPNFKEIYQAVQETVAEEFELQIHQILLLRTGSIPMTTSGKIRRNECRKRFLSDRLLVEHEWKRRTDPNPRDIIPTPKKHPNQVIPLDKRGELTAEFLQNWLKEKIAHYLNLPIEDIDITESLDRYGFDSIIAPQLADEMQTLLKRDVSPLIFYDLPTIESLSQHVEEAAST